MRPEVLERIRADIEEAEKVITAMRSELERAKRAGIDVTEQEARLIELERRLELLKREYG